MTIPFDNVDKELIGKPKKLNIKSLKRFMFFMGPVSSLFDIVVFSLLWFVFTVRDVTHFQTIWFTYSIVSNLIGMHIIRTAKTPFIQSNAHKAVYISSILLIIIGIIVPFTPLGTAIGLAPIALKYIFMIFGVTFLYCIVASYAKKIYIKKYKDIKEFIKESITNKSELDFLRNLVVEQEKDLEKLEDKLKWKIKQEKH